MCNFCYWNFYQGRTLACARQHVENFQALVIFVKQINSFSWNSTLLVATKVQQLVCHAQTRTLHMELLCHSEPQTLFPVWCLLGFIVRDNYHTSTQISSLLHLQAALCVTPRIMRYHSSCEQSFSWEKQPNQPIYDFTECECVCVLVCACIWMWRLPALQYSIHFLFSTFFPRDLSWLLCQWK